MPRNLVLIDYENVQPAEVEALQDEKFEIIVFVGPKQKIAPDMAQALQPKGTSVRYLQISGNGRNALDFHIAYYLGRETVNATETYFHILSKDTGFDPLIEHLRSLGVHAHRVATISDIPILKALARKQTKSKEVSSVDSTIADKARAIAELLSRPKATLPKKLATLERHIKAHLRDNVREDEILRLIAVLASVGFVEIKDSKVRYPKLEGKA